jgi:hypothetical protein
VRRIHVKIYLKKITEIENKLRYKGERGMRKSGRKSTEGGMETRRKDGLR